MIEPAVALSSFLMISYLLVTYVSLCCWKTDRQFIFSWLMSCPDCKLVLNYAGSPRHFSSHDCKMENVENPIMALFPMGGVLLKVLNRKERCHAWSPGATTSHVQALSMLFFQDSTGMSIILFVPCSGDTTWLCLCISNSNRVYFLILSYH
jgi:hypothetical protein